MCPIRITWQHEMEKCEIVFIERLVEHEINWYCFKLDVHINMIIQYNYGMIKLVVPIHQNSPQC
jgi:hypothetical protein